MALTDYHDISLANYIALGAKVKVHYKTVVLRMRESHEERIGEWQDALREYDITPALRDQTDLDTLIAFFRARNGPRYAFKFPDPMDYSATAEVFGTGNSTQTVFQLIKRYNSGLTGDSHSAIRPIYLPDTGLQLFHNGTLYTSGVTTDLQTGIVTFSSAPANGLSLTWTGTFQVPVRFTTRQMYSAVEVYERFEAQIVLMEQRTPVPSYTTQETQSADFIEVNFPTDWAERSSVGPQYDIITIPSDGGESKRVAQFTEAKIAFQVDFSEKTLAQLQVILAFFIARRGRLVGFRLRDITDYRATNQVIGLGDAVETEFQLLKIYTSGSETQIRTISKPVSGSVYLDAVLASPQPTISTVTGLVTFITPPGNGVIVTWTGTFDVPVRFDTDTFEADITGYEVHGWQGCTLTEIMTDLPATEVADVAISLQTAVSGCATRPFPEVEPVTKYILHPGTSTGTVTISPLQLRSSTGHHFGSAAYVFNNITSVTVAFVVSHLTYPGTIFKLPQATSDWVGHTENNGVFYDSGARVQLGLDGTITCDIGTGGVKVYTLLASGDGTGHCLEDGADASHAEFSPSRDIDPDSMQIYCVTFDWFNAAMYVSGTVSGFTDFVRDMSNFISQTCSNVNRIGILPTVSSTIINRFTLEPVANTIGSILSDMSIGGDAGLLGGFGGAEAYNGWGGRLYELIVAPSEIPLSIAGVQRLFHTPILAYFGSLYGVGYPRRRRLAIQSGALRFRADTDVVLYTDIQINAVQEWGNQGVTAWSGRSGSSFDWRHPTQVSVSGSLPLPDGDLTLFKIPKTLLYPL